MTHSQLEYLHRQLSHQIHHLPYFLLQSDRIGFRQVGKQLVIQPILRSGHRIIIGYQHVSAGQRPLAVHQVRQLHADRIRQITDTAATFRDAVYVLFVQFIVRLQHIVQRYDISQLLNFSQTIFVFIVIHFCLVIIL